MTDAEIKNALECCWHSKDCVGNECPLFEPVNDCAQLLAMNALDLINRQQAEVERLNRITDDLEKIADTRKKANFSLLQEKILLTRELKSAKAEAIKDFAEKLKENTREFGSANGIQREIDNLVKEMAGDAE